MLFVLITGFACLILQGCHPSGYDSDQTLRDRYFRNRADFDELIRLFQLQPANDKVDEITANTNPPGVPKPPVPSTTWTKIHDLLIKLNAEKIERVDSGISVEVDVKDGLTNGAYYFFFIVRPCRIAWFPVCIKRDPTTTTGIILLIICGWTATGTLMLMRIDDAARDAAEGYPAQPAGLAPSRKPEPLTPRRRSACWPPTARRRAAGAAEAVNLICDMPH